MPPPPRAAALPPRVRLPLVLAALTALLLVGPAAAQNVTPLQGQGVPTNATTDVYLSVYLDRLLEVNDVSYLHSGVYYMYLDWRDPTAYATIQASTAAMRAGNYTCARPCTDWTVGQACCDGIYMPSLFFRNSHSFPQDRATGYRIVALPDGRVAWNTFVQASFFQPMNIAHYPFDSFDLLILLEFSDTSPPDHPGIRLHMSSAGTSLVTFGKGDAVSQWSITGANMTILPSGDPVAQFKRLSIRPSDPSDPLGLTNTQAGLLRGVPSGASNFSDARNATIAAITITIKRFWRYHLLYTVLPVVLLGLISFVTFFLDCKDLASRLGLIVTLFLAMAALQFVVVSQQPATGYVLPPTQAALATYVVLALIAVESIIVYRIETQQERAEKAWARNEARLAYLAKRTAAKQAAAAAAAEGAGGRKRCGCLPTTTRFGGAAGCGCLKAGGSSHLGGMQQQQEAAAAAAGEAALGGQGAGAASLADSANGGGLETHLATKSSGAGAPYGSGSGGNGGARHRLMHSETLAQSQAYDSWLADRIDKWSLAVLLLAFVVSIILIFVLQSGYTDLFEYT